MRHAEQDSVIELGRRGYAGGAPPAALRQTGPVTTLTCSAVLFDMDGTLVDSTALVDHTWTVFSAAHGLDAAAVLAYAHGRPTVATLREFLPDHPDHRALFAELEDAESDSVAGSVEIAGAADLVRALPAGTWALVTSASRAVARLRLAEIGLELPDVVVAAEDVTVGKPDPEPYLAAAQALGVDPADCVVFEDAPAGVRSGLDAGATVVAVGDAAGPDAADLVRVPHHRAARVRVLDDGRLELTL